MNTAAVRTVASGFILAALLPATTSLATPQSVATLSLQYQQSDNKLITDGEALFGHYLGSGNGEAAGALRGTVGWDLYEDQTRDDLHPAHFRAFLEHDGRRYRFQIIGVYTPVGDEKVMTPGGHETIRHWSFSGVIVFEDDALLGQQHAPVKGVVDTGEGKANHTVWVDRGVEQ